MNAIKIRLTYWLRKIQRRWLLHRVQKALGIKLYAWQYKCLLTGDEPPEWVYSTRRCGKTMFRILDLLLTEGQTITLSPCCPWEDRMWKCRSLDQGAYNAAVWMREDAINRARQKFFINEMLIVKDKLAIGGVKTRRIRLVGWGPYQPNGEW